VHDQDPTVATARGVEQPVDGVELTPPAKERAAWRADG
jgi:hypothetical protein